MTHNTSSYCKRAMMLVALLALGFQGLRAQVITVTANKSFTTLLAKSTTLDQAYLRCQYHYTWTSDTTKIDAAPETDDMVLEVGKQLSRFYSYQAYVSDSLRALATQEEILANPRKYLSGSALSIYKNYPDGKLMLTNKIMNDFFSYEEDLPEFEWNLGDSTSTLLGYPVQMATCSFRGREYVAWFTPEIAVSEGPWKFRGLPGLILKVADTRNQYVYEMTGITQPQNTPILFKEYKYLKTSRKRYLQTLRRYEDDPIGYLTNSSSDIKIEIRNEDGTENTDFAKPHAMTYDFMERDIK